MGAVGLVPMLGAAIGWRATMAGKPREALATVAACGGLLGLLLATVVAPEIGHTATPRALFPDTVAGSRPVENVASFQHTPPSIVFYAREPVPKLETPVDVARHLAAHPDARLIVDSRMIDDLSRTIPASHGVVAEARTVSARHLLLIAPLPDTRVAASHFGHTPLPKLP